MHQQLLPPWPGPICLTKRAWCSDLVSPNVYICHPLVCKSEVVFAVPASCSLPAAGWTIPIKCVEFVSKREWLCPLRCRLVHGIVVVILWLLCCQHSLSNGSAPEFSQVWHLLWWLHRKAYPKHSANGSSWHRCPPLKGFLAEHIEYRSELCVLECSPRNGSIFLSVSILLLW